MAFRNQIEGFETHMKSITQGLGSFRSTGQTNAPSNTNMATSVNKVAQATNTYDESPCLDKGKSKEAEPGSKLMQNIEDDGSEGGGAPLYSPPHSAKAETSVPSVKEASTKSEKPADDELALVRASANFGDLNKPSDPFTDQTPQVPRSVPPMTNPYRQHVDFPGNANEHANQSANRYRGSISSNDSRNSISSGGYGAGMSANHTFFNETTAQQLSTIHHRIMTTLQYIMVSPGVASEVGARHRGMMQEISAMVQHFGRSVAAERDAVMMAKNDDYHQYKNALYDDRGMKFQLDKTESQLQLSQQREQHLKERIDMYKEKISMAKTKLSELETKFAETKNKLAETEKEASRFRQHHNELCEKYSGQDETHYKQVHQLEEEIKFLRKSNERLAKKAGVPVPPIILSSAERPPSAPQSTTSSKDTDDDDDDIVSYTGSFVYKKRALFTPNPLAPTWTPAQKNDKAKMTSATSDSTQNTSHTPRGAPLYPRSDSPYAPLKTGTPAAKPQNPAHHYFPVPSVSEADSERVAFPPGPPSFPAIDTTGRTVYPNADPDEPFGNTPEDALGNPDAARDWAVDDVRSAVNHLYELAKGIIVNQFRDGSPNVPDHMLATSEKQTWRYLLDMVYPGKPEGYSHMKFLLGVGAFRPYILERMMLDYIFKKIIAPVIFLGFTPEMDSHLNALQKQIGGFANDDPSKVSRGRQRVISEHARLVKAILTHRDATKFKMETVDFHSAILTSIMRPMRCSKVTDDSATKAMNILLKASWNATCKIWTSKMTLHYYFPDCGTKFGIATMTALNGQQLASTPEQLQFNQYRISFVVAPTLTLRDDREADFMRTFGIRKAEVIVMK